MISDETSPVTYFLLVPDDEFLVRYNGNVVVQMTLTPGKKHLLYVYARDGDPDGPDTKYSE